MNIKKAIYLPVFLLSSICMANVSLDLNVKINDIKAEYKDLNATKETTNLSVNDDISMAVTVLSESADKAEIELVFSAEQEVISKPVISATSDEEFYVHVASEDVSLEVSGIAHISNEK